MGIVWGDVRNSPKANGREHPTRQSDSEAAGVRHEKTGDSIT
jgi:hypothetical protein